MRKMRNRARQLFHVLLIAPCIALGGIKTNFERIGLRRIKFGGTFQLREPFRGVRAGRAVPRAGRDQFFDLVGREH